MIMIWVAVALLQPATVWTCRIKCNCTSPTHKQ